MREFDESKTVSEGFSTTDEYLEMLEAAIESSEIGYLIADSDCNVIKINQAQIDITGQNAAYNLGRNMTGGWLTICYSSCEQNQKACENQAIPAERKELSRICQSVFW